MWLAIGISCFICAAGIFAAAEFAAIRKKQRYIWPLIIMAGVLVVGSSVSTVAWFVSIGGPKGTENIDNVTIKAKLDTGEIQKTVVGAPNLIEETLKRETQKRVRDFEKSIYDLEDTIGPTMDNYTEVMGNIGKGYMGCSCTA